MAGLATALTATQLAVSQSPAVADVGTYSRAVLSGSAGDLQFGAATRFDTTAATYDGGAETLTATLSAPGQTWTLTVQAESGGTIGTGRQEGTEKVATATDAGLDLTGDVGGALRECAEVYGAYEIRDFGADSGDEFFGLDFELNCTDPAAEPTVRGFVAYRQATGVLDETAVDPGDLVPVDPTRLLDTRESTPIGSNSQRDLDVTTGPVPATGVQAVVLNVTAVNPTQSGYVTVFPAGVDRPTASNLNFLPGQVRPNLVTVQVGATGDVTIYNYLGDTHVVVDVVGYYAPSDDAGGARFRSQQPQRLLDTREPGGGGPFSPNEVRDLQVATAGTTAAVLNVTVDRTVGPGFATVYPADLGARPLASNLNWAPGEIVPNLVVVRLSPGGAVKLTTNGNTDMIVDLVGTFVTDDADPTGRFVSVAPVRLVDTREPGGGGPLADAQTREPWLAGLLNSALSEAGGDVYPTEASAMLFNTTVADTTGDSFLTVWPSGQPRPTASNLNWKAGEVRPNLVAMGTDGDGFASFYNLRGNTALVVDAAGWFTA